MTQMETEGGNVKTGIRDIRSHSQLVSSSHTPVLLHEVIQGLSLVPGAAVVDATLGAGGYSRAICDVIGAQGTLVGFDQDASAVLKAREALSGAVCTIHLLECNFKDLDAALSRVGVEKVDAMVFDLGLSSIQLANSGRGFSFQNDEPLLMTFKEHPRESDVTAEHIVNTWGEQAIADVLFGYGEERYARQIARRIVEARNRGPIATTGELVRIIEASVPAKYAHQKIHPATRTFQALRIAVNDEVTALERGLSKGFEHLKEGGPSPRQSGLQPRKGGRMAVVSFHSIEDRIVKRFFVSREEGGLGKRITKKPIVPTDDEISQNPRSRSAKLRIFEKN